MFVVLVVYVDMDVDVLAIMPVVVGLVKSMLLVVVEVMEGNKHVIKVSKKQIKLKKMRRWKIKTGNGQS